MMIAIVQNRDFRSIGDGMLGRMAALDTEFGSALTRIQEFVRANYETMDPEDLRLHVDVNVC
jgi:hypothetical protein